VSGTAPNVCSAGTWPLPPDLLEFQHHFAAALDRPASGAMAVYRNTVLHGAVEALRSNYPVVEQILGGDMFEAVAVDFASTCPPETPVLALYGAELADWLGHQGWIGDLPYLRDVARVERLRVECLFAADREPNPSKKSNGGLRLHPAVRFTWLSTPAMSIWLAHQQPLTSDFAPDWVAEGAFFSRPDPFTLMPAVIDPAAHRVLAGLRLGEEIGDSISAAAEIYPATDFQALLQTLITMGAFAPLTTERT
jgi:putative DNA-binding protein